MKRFTPGRTASLRIRLVSPSEGLAVSVVDSVGAVVAAGVVSVSGNATALAVDAAIGAQQVVCAGAVSSGWWAVGDEVVEIVSADTVRGYLRSPLVQRHPADSAVLPLTVDVVISIPSSVSAGEYYLQKTSGVRSEQESILIFPREFPAYDPFADIPRLRQLAPGRADLVTIGEEAVEDLRGRLYADGLILDSCTIPGRCRAYLRAWCMVRAAELGADVLGVDTDRQGQIEYLQRQLNAEYKNLSRQQIFASLTTATPGPSGWRVRW